MISEGPLHKWEGGGGGGGGGGGSWRTITELGTQRMMCYIIVTL